MHTKSRTRNKPDVLHPEVVKVPPLLRRPLLMLRYVLLMSPFLQKQVSIILLLEVYMRRMIIKHEYQT